MNASEIIQPTILNAFFKLKKIVEKKLQQSNPYAYLYICARSNGKALQQIWIDLERKNLAQVLLTVDELDQTVNSYEIEFLSNPMIKLFNLSTKNQWNNMRGKYAVIMLKGGQAIKVSSLQMIAGNLSFTQVISNSFSPESLPAADKIVSVTLYKTEQYLCAETFSGSHNEASDSSPISMYRGNQLVSTKGLSREQIQQSAKLMAVWLANQIDESGKANYKYWPSRDAYSEANNAIRQLMATVCLNRSAKAFKSEWLAEVAARNLAYNLNTMYKAHGELGYIWLEDSAKLGASALAALAILESPARTNYLKQEHGLRKLIEELSNKNGSFDTFYIPRERTDNQNFYSGEALLFLAQEYAISKNPGLLSRILASFNYYRAWHLQNRNPAFVPWHTQAYFIMWNATKNIEFANFIFEMNDWLLGLQQETAPHSDMQGRFYDPQRPHFGPPHASSTGVYLEGLIDAYKLALNLGELKRIALYKHAIFQGARNIIQLQFKDDVDLFYIAKKELVKGGIRTDVYDNTIRIDNVQHCLMAFLKIFTQFSDLNTGRIS